MMKKYIYDYKSNSYLEFTSDEFQTYFEQNKDTNRTAFIYDGERWTGYPIKIAYQILMGTMDREEFLNKIKENLIMLK